MAITDSSLAWKTEFLLNETTKQFQFTDQTDYAAAGDSDTDKLGYFKIVSPDGTTFYQNAAFDGSPVYSSPDIDINNGDTTNIQTGSIITVPLLSGLLLQGTYTIYYKIRDTGTTTNYNASKTFDVFYTKPVADINLEADVYAPELTSSDDTNYVITINGQQFSPTISRVHKIIYPLNFGTVSGTGATLSTQTFYTTVNQSTVTATCTWSIGSNVFIVDEVFGGAQLNVEASQGLCDAYCAVKSLYDRWQLAIASNQANAVTLGSNFVIAMSIMGLIKQAYSCGETADIDNLFVQLYKYAPDNCGCQSTNTPTLVTAIGSPTSPWNTILNGTTAPDDADGVNGDFYINTSDSDIPLYIKSAGSWTLVSNLKGATGATGATGAAGANGTNGTNGTTIIDFDVAGTVTISADPQIIYAYTLAGGTLTQAGDTVLLRASASVPSSGGVSGASINFISSPSTSTQNLKGGTVTASDYMNAEVEITYVTSTTYTMTLRTFVFTNSGSVFSIYTRNASGSLGSGDWSSPFVIRLQTSGVASGDIDINSVKIELKLV